MPSAHYAIKTAAILSRSNREESSEGLKTNRKRRRSQERWWKITRPSEDFEGDKRRSRQIDPRFFKGRRRFVRMLPFAARPGSGDGTRLNLPRVHPVSLAEHRGWAEVSGRRSRIRQTR